MAFRTDSQLDVPILAILHDHHQPGRWLTAPQIAAGLVEHDLHDIAPDLVQQRLVLLMAERAVECRACGDELEWRGADGVRRSSSDADAWLSDDEAFALQALKRFSCRQLTGTLAMRAEKLFTAAEIRLRRRGCEGGRHQVAWHRKVAVIERHTPMIPPRIRETILGAVLDSLFEERYIEIVYRPRAGPERNRTLQPLGVVEKAGFMYLVGLEGEEPDPVCIRLDRLQSATVLSEPFSYPETFCLTDYVTDVGDFGIRSEGHVRLALRFPKGQSHQVRDAPISGDQYEEIRPDGSLVIRCTCDVNDRLLRWLLAQGAEVEVMEPLALRRMFAHEARMLTHIYCRK